MNPTEDVVLRLPDATLYVDLRNARAVLVPRRAGATAAPVFTLAELQAAFLLAAERKEAAP